MQSHGVDWLVKDRDWSEAAFTTALLGMGVRHDSPPPTSQKPSEQLTYYKYVSPSVGKRYKARSPEAPNRCVHPEVPTQRSSRFERRLLIVWGRLQLL